MKSVHAAESIRAAFIPNPLSGSDWTDMNASGAPPGYLLNMAMVYDSDADRMIVFGGYDGSPDGSNETWAYDFASNGWTNLAPKVHPNAGWLDRAAYDSWAKRTILFGGWDGVRGTYSNETWAFNFGADTWTNLSPARHPSARSRQGMAFDVGSNRIIIFGGHTIEDRYSSETWAYNLDWNTWANMTTGVRPLGRRSPGMAYDSKADRVILFGGYDSKSGVTFNDTWAYDFDTNTWTNMTPPTAPSPRFGLGFSYDSAIDRCILFGGAGGGDNVTWAYDFSNNTWSTVNTVHSPPAHFLQGMAYDAHSTRTIMFAGEGGAGNDTWALQTQISPPLAPQHLTAIAGNGTVALSWSPPGSDGLSPIKAYRVYRGPDVRNLTVIADLGDILTYLDGNVTNGVTYVYRVSAVNAIGEGTLSGPANATPDGKPPVTTATLSGCEGLAGWFTCPVVTVTLWASDDFSGVAHTSYRVDGVGWYTYARPFSVTHDGVHAVDFFSVDKVGNAESVQSVSVHIDTVAPTSRAVLNGSAVDSYWFRSNVTVSVEAADTTSGVASVTFRLDSGDWRVYNSPLDVGDGRHVLESNATDVAGNPEGSHTIAFGVDTTAPSVGITLSGPRGDKGWYVGAVIVSIDASDATSGVSVSYRLDGAAWMAYGGSFVVSNEGAHTVSYMAVDGTGNSKAGTASFSIDGTPPRAVLMATGTTGAAGWFVSSVVVSLQGDDGGSGLAGIHVQIDGGASVIYTTPISLAAGIHRIDYFATDAAGNVEPAQTATIRIDTIAPTSKASVSGTTGSGGWYTTPGSVSLAGSDELSGLDRLTYRVDEGSWLAYTKAVLLDSDGAHVFAFFAQDVAGNKEAVRSMTIRVDTTAPQSGALLSGQAGEHGWYRTPVRVTLQASDAASGVSALGYRVDGGAWAPYASPFVVGAGIHAILFAAKDVADNTELSHTITIRVDNAPPMLGTVRPSGHLVAGDVSFSWSATDDGSGLDHFEISIDGGAWAQIGTAPLATLHLSDGAHNVTVRAVDVAGNPAEASVSVTVDTNAFSLGGPQGPLPTLAIIAGIAVVVSILEWIHRRRRA